jgi:hypothetical protein
MEKQTMTSLLTARGAFWPSRLFLSFAFILGCVPALLAQPKITSIVPPTGGVDLTSPTNTVTIIGSGFLQAGAANQPAPDLAFAFNPASAVSNYHVASINADGSAVVALALATTVQGIINVTPTANGATGPAFAWDTGIAVNTCLEAAQVSGCQLRWEVDATGVTGSSSQTNKSNSGNFLITLDYQVAKNKDTRQNALIKAIKMHGAAATTAMSAAADKPSGAATLADRLGVHLIFKTGYTQVTTANVIAPTTTSSPSGSTPAPSSSTPACTGSSTTSSGSSNLPCIAATPQNAFIADAKITTDFTLGQNGQTVYSAIGFGAHGTLEDLVQNNQVVQSGGSYYSDLASLNPKNLVGIYEGVFRYRLSQPGHDKAANSGNAAFENVSDLLVIEAGAQYDSGLSHLVADQRVNTRNRFVGRFSAFPELPNAKHTKLTVGLEVSAGINGGPKVVKIFWGANLNPLSLFSH